MHTSATGASPGSFQNNAMATNTKMLALIEIPKPPVEGRLIEKDMRWPRRASGRSRLYRDQQRRDAEACEIQWDSGQCAVQSLSTGAGGGGNLRAPQIIAPWSLAVKSDSRIARDLAAEAFDGSVRFLRCGQSA